MMKKGRFFLKKGMEDSGCRGEEWGRVDKSVVKIN